MNEPVPPNHPTIWPVFAAAAGLMAFGFVTALGSPSVDGDAGGAQDAAPPIGPPSRPTPEADAPFASPIVLKHAENRRRFDVRLQQTRRRGEHDVETTIATVVDEFPVAQTGGLFVERLYDRTTVTVTSDGEPVAPRISADVASLVDAAAHRVELDANGAMTSFALVDTEASQLHATTALLRDGLDLLTLRTPGEPVLFGETWTWTLAPRRPAASSASTSEVEALQGKIDVRARVVGGTVDEPLVELTIDGEFQKSMEVGAEPLRFQSTVRGSGTVSWDASSGHSSRTRIAIEQSATLGASTTSSEIRLSLDALPVE